MKIEGILKTIWNEFIYGGHLFSIGAVSIVFTSAILLNIKITWDCLLVVYLGMHSAYLYNRYKELNKDRLTNPKRTKHLQGYLSGIPFIIIIFVILLTLVLVRFSQPTVLFFGLFLLFVSLLYSIIFKKFTQKLTGFKNFFVSLMWSSLLIFLLFYYSLPFSLSFFLVFIFIYIRLFLHEIFSDIKDMKIDKKENLLTIPIFIKKQKLLNILLLLTILAVAPIIVGVYSRLFPLFSLMLLFTIPYTFYYLKKLEDRNEDVDFLYNVIVDGEFILWSFFVLIGKTIL